jgi:hypothetical protein
VAKQEEFRLGFGGRGLVQVLYGAPGGFSAALSQLWSRADFGFSESYAFGVAMASGDFDGDGFSDLAVADPRPAVDAGGAGDVVVAYGSPEGLSTKRAQLWSQDSPGIPGQAQSGDQFGGSLTAGNLGYGPQADLAIGIPGEDGVGAVLILFGGAGGLTVADNQVWSQNSPGVPGRPADDDRFGGALTAGDFDGGGFDELVVGVPGDRVAGTDAAGAVHVLRGSKTGLTAKQTQRWTQGQDGIQGEVTDAGFGATLAVGQFTDSGHLDLAVGNPDQLLVDTGSAGTVNVIYGSRRGLSADGNQQWSEFTLGTRARCDCDAPSDNPRFGASLVAADFGRGAADDLVVGVPGALTPGNKSGAVQVLYGTPDGLRATRTQQISQVTPGIRGDDPGEAEFGTALAVAGPSASSGPGKVYPTLIVGAPGYNGRVDESKPRGILNLIRGSASGLTTTDNEVWTANRLPQEPVGERFGLNLNS